MYGEYQWSETIVGSDDTEPCDHGGFDDSPRATRLCGDVGSWNDEIFDECFTLITSQYQQFNIVS